MSTASEGLPNFLEYYLWYQKFGFERAAPFGNPAQWELFKTQFSPITQLLKKYGSDAHMYLPGAQTPVLGPELVVNGDFSNGTTGWALGTGWGVYSGTAQYSGNGTWMETAVPTIAGQRYRVMFGNSGSMFGGVWTSPNQSGAIIAGGYGANALVEFVASGSISYVGWAGGAAYTVDNASVKLFSGYSDTYQGFHTGNYIDSAGTQPAVYDQPVGLVLDAAGSVGADVVVGGDFSSAAQWSSIAGFTIASGALSINAGGGAITNNAGASAVIGKTYKIDFDVPAFTSGQVKAFMGGAGGVAANAVGHYSSYVVATTTDKPQIYVTSGGTVCQVDNLVVKEITGTHASQQTVGYKPIGRRGIVNLLTWSNDLTNAAWGIKSDGVSVTSNSVSFTTDPYSRCLHGYTFTAGAITVSASFSAADAGKTVRIGVWDSILDGLASGKSPSLTIPASGVVVFSISSSGGAGYIGLVGDGVSVTLTNPNVGIFLGTLTAQQILAAGGIPLTTTAPASSSAGPNYLEFVDANAQCLLRPAASVGASGWAVVSVAASKLGNMSPMGSLGTSNQIGYAGYAFKFRANGDVWLRIGDGSGNPGSISEVYAGEHSYQIGQPIILSMRWTAGGQFVGRVNGVDIGSVVCVNTSGANGGVVIGAHNATGAEYFSGKIFFAQDGVGTITTQDIQQLERFAAQRAGIQL